MGPPRKHKNADGMPDAFRHNSEKGLVMGYKSVVLIEISENAARIVVDIVDKAAKAQINIENIEPGV